jgi:hypothetical protein
MRTRYRIDDFQQSYFVIDDFQQLFDATRPDFAPIYREIAALPDIGPDALIDEDVAYDPTLPRLRKRGGGLSAAAKPEQKNGPRLTAAQV